MKKIENLFVGIGLVAIVAGLGALFMTGQGGSDNSSGYRFPATKYGAFLAAQHAVYVNDFDSASKFADVLSGVDYPMVQNTKILSEFLGGNLPQDAKLLKNEKSTSAQIIYDAYLITQNDWKGFHNRHKTDTSALMSPLRIWSAIANDWRTNTFKFIDTLPTNKSWKAFVRGQIYAELGDVEKAAQHFADVDVGFMNINDYLYLMSFYNHHGFFADVETLRNDFTSRPGGLFMKDYHEIPDWSVYSGYENQLAFSLIQNVSHTQVMMYSDLSMLFLRFAQITAPDFSAYNDSVEYYLGQYYYNNTGDYQTHFNRISPQSPFYAFATLRIAERNGDISELEQVVRANPLFVPGINTLVAKYVQNGQKKSALRVLDRALSSEDIDGNSRAFFYKSRANVHFAFGDYDSAQDDLHSASMILIADMDILSLQAKIWAMQNREIENAYDYAMTLVTHNPSDVMAWDTLACVVNVREGTDAALEVLERVGEIADTCSSLFQRLGDLYAQQNKGAQAIDAYMRAIELSDDGLVVVPELERKIRKLK